ncbi:MAG: glycosyltransferase [Candidatus Dojkabacteria bacterium]
MKKRLIKISIVTPSFNSAKYLEGCLLSVLNQKGDFSIEHFVVDGVSTDNSIQLLKDFEQKIEQGVLEPKRKGYKFSWSSKKDSGMYDAILKGFEKTSGEIMAWINADDMYQEGAFEEITKILDEKKEILWIKGITDYIEKNGTLRKGDYNRYHRSLIVKGAYGTIGKYIQQDSVFWKRELWSSVGHNEIGTYKLAGDFRLWQLFAEKTKLYSIPKHISYFRKIDGQLSSNMERYLIEAKSTVKYSALESLLFRFFLKVEKAINIFFTVEK